MGSTSPLLSVQLACAGNVGLRDIECTALKQILEVEPCELALTRGNRNCRRSAHLCLTGVIVGRDRLLEPSDVVGLKFLGKLDGGRNLKRAVRVDHQFDVGAKTAASRLHPAHTVGDREAVTTHHTHLGSSEALGGVARELGLGLVAWRPAAARIAPHRAARRAKRLVERNPERLRLDVPYRDVDAGNCFHDDTAASAFISLGDATLERRPAARAVVHHSAASSCSMMAATIGGVPRAAPMPVRLLSVATRISVASLLTLVPRSVR